MWPLQLETTRFTSRGDVSEIPQYPIGGQSPATYNLCALGHMTTEASSHLRPPELVKTPDAAALDSITQGVLGSAVGAHML